VTLQLTEVLTECDRATSTTTSSLWHNIHSTIQCQISGTWSGIRILSASFYFQLLMT